MSTALEHLDEEEMKRFDALRICVIDGLINVKMTWGVHKDFSRRNSENKPPKYWKGTVEEWKETMQVACRALGSAAIANRPAYVMNLFYKLTVERWKIKEQGKLVEQFRDFLGKVDSSGPVTFDDISKIKEAILLYDKQSERIETARKKFVVPLDDDEDEVEPVDASDASGTLAKSEAI